MFRCLWFVSLVFVIVWIVGWVWCVYSLYLIVACLVVGWICSVFLWLFDLGLLIVLLIWAIFVVYIVLRLLFALVDWVVVMSCSLFMGLGWIRFGLCCLYRIVWFAWLLGFGFVFSVVGLFIVLFDLVCCFVVICALVWGLVDLFLCLVVVFVFFLLLYLLIGLLFW